MKINQKSTANKFAKIVIFFLFLIVILTWQAVVYLRDDRLHINFLSIGQGDAIHIRKNNIDVLIDGGPDDSILSELGKTMPFYDRTIEYVILTHPDADHITGLVYILKSYDIEAIYLTDVVKDTGVYIEFLRQIEDKNVTLQFVKSEDNIQFQDDFVFFIFWPKANLADQGITNTNDASIVGQLVYKNISVLFTGDVENDLQKRLIGEYHNRLKSDILKVAHHGSKNATNDEFLYAVNPEIAIISDGEDNRFGHPHKETLDLLEKFSIRTFRTDLDGTVSIISDGLNFWKK